LDPLLDENKLKTDNTISAELRVNGIFPFIGLFLVLIPTSFGKP